MGNRGSLTKAIGVDHSYSWHGRKALDHLYDRWSGIMALFHRNRHKTSHTHPKHRREGVYCVAGAVGVFLLLFECLQHSFCLCMDRIEIRLPKALDHNDRIVRQRVGFAIKSCLNPSTSRDSLGFVPVIPEEIYYLPIEQWEDIEKELPNG